MHTSVFKERKHILKHMLNNNIYLCIILTKWMITYSYIYSMDIRKVSNYQLSFVLPVKIHKDPISIMKTVNNYVQKLQ